MKRLNKILIALAAMACLFLGYRIRYPNDFFLSDKEFKNSAEYNVNKSLLNYSIVKTEKESDDLKEFMSNPDFYLERPTKIFKDNHKRCVKVVQVGHTRFFVKKYKFKNLFDYITKCPFRSSKAFRSLYYAHLFKKEDIKTLQPLAFFEKRLGPLWTYSYLVFEYEGGPDLETFFSSASLSEQENILSKLSDNLKTFYKKKWVHRDLSLRNILFKDGELYFLDLDDMHSYAYNNPFFREKYFKKHTEKISKDLDLSPQKFSTKFLSF